MTAIFGVWEQDGAPGAALGCAQMQRALAIYGSDAVGIADEGAFALGISLARLTPEDRFDRQPLRAGGGRWHITADLRLDNRAELAAMLAIPPADLTVMADSDLLLRAWERWQEGCLDHIVGDFAMAVWDGQERRLSLIRDLMGSRPLFYGRSGGRLAFATMAKGIHALGDIPPTPDLDRVRDYLALTPTVGSNSFFAGISHVGSGEIVSFHADGREVRRRWYDWEAQRPVRYARDADYVEAFRELFDRAVADRLRTTGSFASHLSSGFDSAAVTVSAARQLAARGQRLTSYTHVPLAGLELDAPKDRVGNEWPVAHDIALRYANIDHVAVDAANRTIGDDLDRHFHYFEYPALNLCNMVWVREIARLANRDRHKVLLTGSVGNATISLEGGERRFELFQSGQWIAWMREVLAAPRHGETRWAFFRSTLGGVLPGPLVNRLKALTGRQIDRLAHYSVLRPEIQDSAAFKAHLAAIGFDTTFRARKTTRELSSAILQRIDVQGLEYKGSLAAYGLDTRDPTADRRIVEFVRNVPTEMFLRNGISKWIYRQAFADRFPASFFDARPKGYQAADWKPRVKTALPRLSEELDRARGVPAVQALINVKQIEDAIVGGVPEGRMTAAGRESLRLRMLRGMSVAHFLRRLDRSNAPDAG